MVSFFRFLLLSVVDIPETAISRNNLILQGLGEDLGSA